MAKRCVLNEEKVCDGCGECSMCDLDPNKICDNCMRCVATGAAYNAIEIDEILVDEVDADDYEERGRTQQPTPEVGNQSPFKRFEPLTRRRVDD